MIFENSNNLEQLEIECLTHTEQGKLYLWLFANLITITFHLWTCMYYFTEMICVVHDEDKNKHDTT